MILKLLVVPKNKKSAKKNQDEMKNVISEIQNSPDVIITRRRGMNK